MRDAGAGGAGDAIARPDFPQRLAMAEHPAPGQHEERLVLDLMGMERAGAFSGRDAGEVDAEPPHARLQRGREFLVGAGPVVSLLERNLLGLVDIDDVRCGVVHPAILHRHGQPGNRF